MRLSFLDTAPIFFSRRFIFQSFQEIFWPTTGAMQWSLVRSIQDDSQIRFSNVYSSPSCVSDEVLEGRPPTTEMVGVRSQMFQTIRYYSCQGELLRWRHLLGYVGPRNQKTHVCSERTREGRIKTAANSREGAPPRRHLRRERGRLRRAVRRVRARGRKIRVREP